MSRRYRYLRAWGAYVGWDAPTLSAKLAQARDDAAPADAYDFIDGKWMTVSWLERAAARGSLYSSDLIDKLREYAGEDMGRVSSPLTNRLRAGRLLGCKTPPGGP